MKTQTRLFGAVLALILSTILITGLVLVQPAHSDETEMYIGLWTEHLVHDDPDYNEANEFIQLSVYNDERNFVTVGTFSNSHYERSHMVGLGSEFTTEYMDGLRWGLMLVAVHGYQQFIDTHAEGLLFAPVHYYEYKKFRLMIFGTVVNAGVKFTF